MIDGMPPPGDNEDEMGAPNWTERERTEGDDHDAVDEAVDEAPAPISEGTHRFLQSDNAGTDNGSNGNQGIDDSRPDDDDRDSGEDDAQADRNDQGGNEQADTMQTIAIPPETRAPDNMVEANARLDEVDGLDESDADVDADDSQPETIADRREISDEDAQVLQDRGTRFFDRYHRSGSLIGSEPIEERRLGGVLPFIGMLGYDVFDRTEVKVVSESRYLVGKEDDRFIVSLDQAGGLPDDIILATNGRKFEIRIQGDDNSTTVALLEIDSDTNKLPRLFHSLSREGIDLGHLRDMASRGAIEDVLREAILDELREPSSHLRQAISDRLYARGYDDSALSGLTAIGQNIAGDAIAGENEPENNEEERERRAMKPDEALAFAHVKELLGAYVNPERVKARTGVQYTAVLLDDNNRRSIVRLYYNATAVKYVATLVARETTDTNDKNKVDETKHLLATPADIDRLADKIVARLKEVEPDSVP